MKIILRLVLLKLIVISYAYSSDSYVFYDPNDIISNNKETEKFTFDKNACAEVSLYFALNNPCAKRISYDEISRLIKLKYGERPYSMYVLECFLLDHNLKSKPIKIQKPKDILNSGFKRFIIFLPPLDNKDKSSGHFSYVEKREEGYYIMDPLISVTPILLSFDSYRMKRWEGVLLLIE